MPASVPSVPGTLTFTLTVSNEVTLITLPNACRKVRLWFETNEGKVAFVGADAAPIDASYHPVAADTKDEFFVDQDQYEGADGPADVRVAAAVVPTVVRVFASTG